MFSHEKNFANFQISVALIRYTAITFNYIYIKKNSIQHVISNSKSSADYKMITPTSSIHSETSQFISFRTLLLFPYNSPLFHFHVTHLVTFTWQETIMFEHCSTTWQNLCIVTGMYVVLQNV